MFIGYGHLVSHALREITKHAVKHTTDYFQRGHFKNDVESIKKNAKQLEQNIERGIDDTWKTINGKKRKW